MSNAKRIWCKYTSIALTFVLFICAMMCLPYRTHAAKTVTQDDLKAMAEEIVWLVNEARAEENEKINAENIIRKEQGLDPLPTLKPMKVVPYLNDKARERSRETIFKFSHYRPSGDTDADLFVTIIDDGLVPYSAAAENIAAGSDNAKATFNQWKNSPGHWKAIMNPDYTHIGVGCSYESNSTYKYYWCQLFISYDFDKYGPLEGEYIAERYKTVPVDTGDINGDGGINTYDLITLNKYLAKKVELNDLQVASADILKDGSVTSADATILRKYILGEYKSLPITMDMLFNNF